jgi:mannose-6-phosphate isomerase-like protein (cupin superfamily)
MARARAKLRSPAKRAAPRPKSRTQPAARRAQKFTVSHRCEEDFRTNGLRAYAKYRDLGIGEATRGMVQAHVIRLLPPFRREEVSKRHYHEVDFQMVYVLKGWIETELDGQGAIVMKEGSCWIQPSGIRHAVLGYSDDCEVLEIVLPADFKTVELE